MTTELPEIVVVDGGTLNPGDLSWEPIRQFGKLSVYDHPSAEMLRERVECATAIITNKVQLRADLLHTLDSLRYIGVTATGYDMVDTLAARERGIVVTNVPGYGTRSVAQMTMALVLELAHRAGHHSEAVKAGRWSDSRGFCFWDHPLLELDGRTMGIIGLGQIGLAVAHLARAFGMKIVAHTRSPEKHNHAGIELVDLEILFRVSDVISLHCPLTNQTAGMVNRDRLRTMKPTALLVNTSRGALVVVEDLRMALCEGIIAGAALDVLDTEPPPRDHVLFDAPNCVITPHIAWATKAARARLLDIAVGNLRAFLSGVPENVVSYI